MANHFNYNTPDDFSKDEEKWFKFFSMKALISTIIFGFIGGFIFIPLFKFFGRMFIGVIITLIFAGIGFSMVSFEIPITTELPGAGHTPMTILFRILLRRLPRNRVIYTKGYGEYENFIEDDYDEEEQENGTLHRFKNMVRTFSK